MATSEKFRIATHLRAQNLKAARGSCEALLLQAASEPWPLPS
jgi:hypothetical protein